MKIVTIKIADLKAAEYNPRQISEEQFTQLKKSIEGFGAVEPIVINKNIKRKNVVVGGHQRLKVMKALGWEEVPCVEVDLPLAREKELNIRLNKNTGEFDFDILANEFDIEDLIEWGFSENELELGKEYEDFSGNNKELLQDDIDTKGILKLAFHDDLYLDILERLQKLKKENDSNESIFLKMLEYYEKNA
jgi:ParB-like chromosome segregation protein Spo0J